MGTRLVALVKIPMMSHETRTNILWHIYCVTGKQVMMTIVTCAYLCYWKFLIVIDVHDIEEKTIDLPRVTDKPYHIMLYTSSWAEFELTMLVVIGTDCTVVTIRPRRSPIVEMELGFPWYDWNIAHLAFKRQSHSHYKIVSLDLFVYWIFKACYV